MELGQYQIQVFISLVVILCAACITVICEFIKNRQQATEEANASQQALLTRTPVDPARAGARPGNGKRPKGKRTVAPEAMAAMERGKQLAARAAEEVQVAPVALQKPVPAPVVEPIPAPIEVAQVIEQVEEIVVAEPVPAAPVSPTKRDWDSVLKSNSEPAKRDWGSVLKSSKVNQVARPVASTRLSIPIKPSALSLPAGFQDGILLTKLVKNRQPVSGLVVSVGVQSLDEMAIPESVDSIIQSLLGARDFAARVSETEYLLIFPSERGSSAERRLTEITEKLSGAESETLASYAILFTCGGVEVRSEAIDEAIASANRCMEEIRSNRRILHNDSLRQAV